VPAATWIVAPRSVLPRDHVRRVVDLVDADRCDHQLTGDAATRDDHHPAGST
jgi:hypothetical protein